MGPVLYLIYTSDIPKLEHDTIATFADDTAIMAVGNDHQEAARNQQTSANKINNWTKKWLIKLNEANSAHVNFTKKIGQHIPIGINDIQVPYTDTAKYLGITLDAKLRWKAHVEKKKEEQDIKFRKMYWLNKLHVKTTEKHCKTANSFL